MPVYSSMSVAETEAAFWDRESAEWMAKRATMNMLLDDTDAVMDQRTFERLNVYSTSVPTGAPVGKIWKCGRRFQGAPTVTVWYLGEYWDDGAIKLTGSVPIRWRLIHVV